MGVMGLYYGEIKTKQDYHSHRTWVSFITFSRLEDLVMINLMLSSMASLSWVWWIHSMTLVTSIAIGMVGTTGYRPFHVNLRFWVRIVFYLMCKAVTVGRLRHRPGCGLQNSLMSSLLGLL